jgi:DNA polymerase-1
MKIRDYADRLQRVEDVVFGMERHGVPIDLEICAQIRDEATRDETETLRRLNEIAGPYDAGEPNWNYPAWLVNLLHDRMGIPPSPYWFKGKVKLWQGERKLDGVALDWLASTNPEHRVFLNLIRAFRQQHRMANYAAGWIDLAIQHPDGSTRLHPSYGMADDADPRPGARSGRFGIKNPALQQVPRDKKKDPYRLRRAFIAAPGCLLVVADYTQLEIVVLAHICKKLFGMSGLCSRLLPGAPDMHSATARYVFGDVLGTPEVLACQDLKEFKTDPVLARFRDLVKRIRYGLAYGKGDYGFGNTLFELDATGDICGPPMGEERAGVLRNALLDMDPELRLYQDWVWEYGIAHRMMPSLLGRFMPGEGIEKGENDWGAKRIYRQFLNWPEQAGANEIVQAAMVACDSAGLVQDLQVHDELHFQVREDDLERSLPLIQELMEHTTNLEACLRAEPKAGGCWDEVH